VQSGEVLVDKQAGVGLGHTITIGGHRLKVVGRSSGLSYRAGVPDVFVTLDDAQSIGYAGQPLAATVVTRGVPTTTPEGVSVLSPSQVRSDVLSPLKRPIQTVTFVEFLLWIVAGMIIGSVVYLTAIDRVRDFAVLKATGASNVRLYESLAFQSMIVTGASYLVAVALSRLLVRAAPMRAEIPTSAYLLLAVVAVVVGLLASFTGLRRSVGVDPALAFSAA
jgi:putative ABC transport system permease protein